jgi:hypothetical protein
MSDIIRFYTLRRDEKPLVPESRYSDMDTISEAQRDFMRLPEGVNAQLWDGLIRRGDDRDVSPKPIPPSRKLVDDPSYPSDDPTVPPRHRRT